ncbi:MAG: proton-conducting transporter transmembrane domain-containing protein [Psychroflexus halocasei]|uniref:proton-conducting transporter transmembrane domain-containing protein n=1 Tax=Psychroflexus sp. S27 TaxID=1982757 RepID=UPI000C2B15B9|nr:proton-conducting transporter membrane subunit [Psychroflexus sp. S27]PJX21567.1 Na+/H+ antiporter subunit D [Psychroflexus sp. S27]
MTNHIITLPLLVNLFISIILMFYWRKVRLQKIVSVAGSIIGLAVAIYVFVHVYQNGTQTVASGSWSAPFGIVFVGDMLAATLVLLTAISALAVSIFSTVAVINARLRFGYFSVFHFLILGLNGAFLTGDIFNLYVWFEIIIISSFVLISIGGEKNQLEGAVKYFTLNFFASMIFLTALGVLYGLAGTLNMADLSAKVSQIDNQVLVEVCAVLFLVGFGIKSAVFPLYFWLPASYHTPPAAVSAIFSGLLTKVGVYALIRVFSVIFEMTPFLQTLLMVIAVLTIFSGGIGSLIQNNIRKVFSYLIICHIGFMIGGLAMFTKVAIAGVAFYLIHDIIIKTNLFLIAGLIFRMKASSSMRKIGGIYATYPKLSLLIALPLFSLIGIPPLSGFWPKISLIIASFELKHYWYFGALIFGSFITLVIIARLWSRVFWKDQPKMETSEKFNYFYQLSSFDKMRFVLPIVLLTIVTLYIGFGAEHIQEISTRIAEEIVNKDLYINAVLKSS